MARKTQRQKLLDYHEKDAVTGCWNWTRGFYPLGYARVSAPEGARYEKASRTSYREFVGPIEDGLMVLHKCDNRKCINPSHLFLGTHKENMRDMVDKGRSASGERQGSSKLKADQVLAILADARAYRDIAKDYGISYGLVGHIKVGRAWKGVTCR